MEVLWIRCHSQAVTATDKKSVPLRGHRFESCWHQPSFFFLDFDLPLFWGRTQPHHQATPEHHQHSLQVLTFIGAQVNTHMMMLNNACYVKHFIQWLREIFFCPWLEWSSSDEDESLLLFFISLRLF